MTRFHVEHDALLFSHSKTVLAPGEKRWKHSYLGAPACFALDMACSQLNTAFQGQCYGVGSAYERADFRDVDVRMMLDDDRFALLFPATVKCPRWEFDPRWLVMTVSISAWLKSQCGLPIDFQFQPVTHANDRHKGPRNPLGMRYREST